jgi:hypothetical protein
MASGWQIWAAFLLAPGSTIQVGPGTSTAVGTLQLDQAGVQEFVPLRVVSSAAALESSFSNGGPEHGLELTELWVSLKRSPMASLTGSRADVR